MAGGPLTPSPDTLRAIRRSRRHPAITQYDYLHLRALVKGLRETIAEIPGPVRDVLDVWCGSRPYEDLLPAGARCVGLDVEGNPYGVADVVSNELLPFPDESFDLLTCIEAFQFMADPDSAVSEFARVLRPGGTALVSLVFGHEYDRRVAFEGRYTEQQLRTLFAGWDDVRVREDGGRTITWTVLTGSLIHGLEQRIGATSVRRIAGAVFASGYALVNAVGLALQRAEAVNDGPAALPMNLTLTARKPRRA
ncbi:MAG: class I SAM-dependent methyltransferase [Gaiellaceae bacterium]